jgi:DNA helicase-4
VKSIGERRIADYFERNNIRYVYEKEARTNALFFSSKISNPDFYLPDYDVYVEYWGLVNADDNHTRTRYVRSMKRKWLSTTETTSSSYQYIHATCKI